MKRIAIIPLLLFTSSFAICQTEDVSLSKATSEFVSVHKKAIGETRSIPPRSIYKIEGYEYLITLTMCTRDPFAHLDSSLTVVCFLPDQTIESIKINPNEIVKGSGNYYKYSFPILMKNEGWFGFTIATEKELAEKYRSSYFSRIGTLQKVFLRTISVD